VTFWEPLNQEIEAPAPGFRSNPRTPTWPTVHQRPEPEKANDLLVRCVFQQPHDGPVAVQPADLQDAVQHLAELGLVNIVVPDVRWTCHGFILNHTRSYWPGFKRDCRKIAPLLVWIASTAIFHEVEAVTRDGNLFRRIEGLIVLDY
jgi:hypothetical protein